MYCSGVGVDDDNDDGLVHCRMVSVKKEAECMVSMATAAPKRELMDTETLQGVKEAELTDSLVGGIAGGNHPPDCDLDSKLLESLREKELHNKKYRSMLVGGNSTGACW